MTSKPEHATTMAAVTAGAIVICGNCGIEERRLLHHVRHRGIFRRLCTTCVLRLHPQFFCPTCFLVYERSPPPDCVTCFKCYSSSHPNCVSNLAPSKTPYVCPSCVNPNLPIFSLKKVRDEKIGGLGSGSESNNSFSFSRAIDKKGAKVLLAAARVASITMNKAAVAARAEAERRAKEAAFTKKRAREALENLVYLMAKEKKKNLKTAAAADSGIVASRVGPSRVDRVDGSTEVLAALNAVELREKEKLAVVNNVENAVVSAVVNRGIVASKVGPSRVDRVDGSTEVLAALNAVELREKEKLAVVNKVENAMVSAVVSNGVAMEVDGDERLLEGVTSVSNGENEKSGDSGDLDKSEILEGDKGSNVVVSGSVLDQPEESGHQIEEKVVSQQ